ncbi:MAG TPA: SDR family NAD(P)-dependent oxidoreductase [Acidimicrobiales bacterium]|nr:SDR family NAD(P)-dependent oxidoreductase [Acidimicrobiales bacterium]
MSGPLEGRVALVTGASRGIGAAIAADLAAHGAAVAVSARTVHDGDHVLVGGIEETASTIAAGGGAVVAVAADLARPDDRTRLVEAVVAQLGPIDILVNNAAITWFEPVDGFKEHHYDTMFEVQVKAPFQLSRLVLGHMRAQKAGWICNISSVAGRHPEGPPYRFAGGSTVYGMCKAALERFSTGLASEVYDDGIAVNALSPSGLVVTPGVEHHKLHERVPKEGHEPVELMATAARLLCSGDPRVLTGRVTYARPLLEELGAVPAGL